MKGIKDKLLYNAFGLFIAYLGITILCWIIATIIGEILVSKIILVLFSILYLNNFIIYAFEMIAKVSAKNILYGKAVFNIFKIIIYGIIFFAINYFYIYILDANSFTGVIGDDFITQIISFLYFSIVTFSTIGFGDILAVSNLARFYVILEGLFSLVIVLLVFSSFSGLIDSFKIKSPFAVNKKEAEEFDDI